MCIFAQESDTLKAIEVKELEVKARRWVRAAESAVPHESLSQQELARSAANTLADAVLQLPSVMLKDYGGIGGLKTISVRSLGAEHTTVQLDGIKLSDTQTGQIDLGKFSLENVARIELSQGNPTDDLSPARAYASASLLSIISCAQDESEISRPIQVRAMQQVGSFDFVSTSLSSAVRLSPAWKTAVSFERQTASGRYPYIFQDGAQAIKLERQNSDVHSTRFEADLSARFTRRMSLRSKLYLYNSERGLPNAAIIANFENSQQRLWVSDAFWQASLEAEASEQVRLGINAKLARNDLRFHDPLALTTGGIDDRYMQREGYIAASFSYKPAAWLTLNAASDVAINTLDATLWQFAKPTRWTNYTVIGAKVRQDQWNLDANLLATFVSETTVQNEAAPARQVLTPTLAIAYKPFTELGLRLRASYKQSFRMPTFNDLYYTRVGNINLRPERVEQINLGAGYELLKQSIVQYAALRVDAFRNLTVDKILAVPRDAFNWTMQNIALVEATGVDVRFESVFKKVFELELSIAANYTYQTVLDITPQSLTFGNQIAYTPFENAAVILSASWKKLAFTWMWSFVGYRYQLGENIMANLLLPYALSDLTLRFEETLWGLNLVLKFDLNNLFDEHYQVIRSFPMPGRNFRLSFSLLY
ncbi:MAG: TonB-dependent receptor [Candidatus Thermochlorobacter sp.]